MRLGVGGLLAAAALALGGCQQADIDAMATEATQVHYEAGRAAFAETAALAAQVGPGRLPVDAGRVTSAAVFAGRPPVIEPDALLAVDLPAGCTAPGATGCTISSGGEYRCVTDPGRSLVCTAVDASNRIRLTYVADGRFSIDDGAAFFPGIWFQGPAERARVEPLFEAMATRAAAIFERDANPRMDAVLRQRRAGRAQAGQVAGSLLGTAAELSR
jgi:hypothetical protein